MGWTVTEDGDDRIRWERSDGYAVLVARATATGEWAVSIDRLEQAPEGPTYDHATVADRDAAREVAETWREEYATD
jgi:hypothetical protein